MTRADLFALVRPWLDSGGFTSERIAALDALCDRIGLAGAPAAAPPLSPTTAPARPGSSYDRAALKRELTRDEGERLKVYRCTADKRTIGVGRNLDDRGISASETAALGITVASAIASGITPEQSQRLLDNDIDDCEADLDRHLPWWRRLDPVRQRVLLNMCFNLGIRGLLGFHKTLPLIRNGLYERAANHMLASKWARQVKGRAVRLAAMMRLGR